MYSVLLKLPEEVARKVLLSFLHLGDILRLDSATLVHFHRNHIQQLYRGTVVNHSSFLELNLPKARGLLTKDLYVANVSIIGSLVDDWEANFGSVMKEAVKVKIHHKSNLDKDKVSDILGKASKLVELDFSYCKLGVDALQAAISLCPLLAHVDVSFTNVDSNIIVPLLSPRILSLDLTFCRQVNDSTIIVITNACTNLQSLKLGGHGDGCTEASLNAITTNCPQLRVLGLEYWGPLPDDSMEALTAGCRELRSLYLACAGRLTSAALRSIAAHCKQLVDISLPCLSRLTTDDMVTLVSSCPQLRTASIPVDDTVLLAVAQHCPHLTELELQHPLHYDDPVLWNVGLAGESMAVLLRSCQDLKQLTIGDNFRMLPPSDGVASSVEVLHYSVLAELYPTDAALHSLLQYLPYLRELHFRIGSPTVHDAVVLAVADCCPLLERISLNGQSGLTDVSIITLAQHCPLLRKVNLTGLKQLTDAAVIAIAQHCPHIAHLCLHNSKEINFPPNAHAVGLHAALMGVDLNTVFVAPDTPISDASIAALAAHSHRLRELDTQGHAHVSQAALDTLTAALPRCAVKKNER